VLLGRRGMARVAKVQPVSCPPALGVGLVAQGRAPQIVDQVDAGDQAQEVTAFQHDRHLVTRSNMGISVSSGASGLQGVQLGGHGPWPPAGGKRASLAAVLDGLQQGRSRRSGPISRPSSSTGQLADVGLAHAVVGPSAGLSSGPTVTASPGVRAIRSRRSPLQLAVHSAPCSATQLSFVDLAQVPGRPVWLSVADEGHHPPGLGLLAAVGAGAAGQQACPRTTRPGCRALVSSSSRAGGDALGWSVIS